MSRFGLSKVIPLWLIIPIICFPSPGFTAEDNFQTIANRAHEVSESLENDIPLCQSAVLERMKNGAEWLTALDRCTSKRKLEEAQQGNKAGQFVGKLIGVEKTYESLQFAAFALHWESILQRNAPLSLRTERSLELQRVIANDQTNPEEQRRQLNSLQQLAEEALLEIEALDRIERFRRKNCTIVVTDKSGSPVANVSVQLRQTRHAFLFGCNIFTWSGGDGETERLYRDQFADLLNFATLGFYWAGYERRPGTTMEKHRRDIAEWCKNNGILCKGHPLVWNYADPHWAPDDPDELYRLQMERITREMTAFAGLIDIWDVVNEVTAFRPEILYRESAENDRDVGKTWADGNAPQSVPNCPESESQRDSLDQRLLL